MECVGEALWFQWLSAPGRQISGCAVDDISIEQKHARIVEDVGDALHLHLSPPLFEIDVEQIATDLPGLVRPDIEPLHANQSRSVAGDEFFDF